MRSWNVFISFSIVSGMVLGTQNHRESWSDVKGKLVVPEQMCDQGSRYQDTKDPNCPNIL